MVHINLLGEKEDRSSSEFLQLFVYAVSVVVMIVGCFVTYDQASTELERLKAEETSLNLAVKHLEAQTKKVNELEQKEKILREKLTTIATLKGKKHGPLHVLAELSTYIPKKSWLDSIKEKAGVIELKGVALDNQTIAVFMGDLQKSQYLSSVDLIQSKQYVKNDVKMKEFSLSVKTQNPLAQKSSNVEGTGKPAEIVDKKVLNVDRVKLEPEQKN